MELLSKHFYKRAYIWKRTNALMKSDASCFRDPVVVMFYHFVQTNVRFFLVLSPNFLQLSSRKERKGKERKKSICRAHQQFYTSAQSVRTDSKPFVTTEYAQYRLINFTIKWSRINFIADQASSKAIDKSQKRMKNKNNALSC